MEAASTEQLERLLGKLQAGKVVRAKNAAATAALIASKVRRSKASLEDVQRLSTGFLDDRRQSMKGVLGAQAYSMPEVDFVFFPILESCAATFIDQDRTTVMLSLGMVEALRLAVASAQLNSAIQRVEQDEALTTEWGTDRHHGVVKQLRTMTQYFNAAAVLHFKEPKQLPGAANLLDQATRHQVDVVLEAVMMFILLHELGHVDFHRSSRRPSEDDHLAWEFVVPEDVDQAKAEELYADRYALEAVPDAFALSLAHAATFFLHLYSYVDASSPERLSTHPLGVNRIAALFAAAKEKSSSEQVGRAAVTRAIKDGASLWARPYASFSLEALRTYAEGLGKTDWRPAQEALQLLARRDQAVAASAVS
jgi:hypothetical protein